MLGSSTILIGRPFRQKLQSTFLLPPLRPTGNSRKKRKLRGPKKENSAHSSCLGKHVKHISFGTPQTLTIQKPSARIPQLCSRRVWDFPANRSACGCGGADCVGLRCILLLRCLAPLKLPVAKKILVRTRRVGNSSPPSYQMPLEMCFTEFAAYNSQKWTEKAYNTN